MRTVLKLFALGLMVALLVLFNAGLIELRLREIGYHLEKFAAQDDVTNTLGIVAKYELVQQRMRTGEEDISNYELEARIAALTSGDKFDAERESGFDRLYLAPVRLVVNGIRFVMGKPILNPTDDDKIYRILEIGYFWERNRKYTEAIDIYNEVLEKPDLREEIRAAVLIHQAFCYSMLSEYDKSRSVYEQVIRLYPTSEAGILAWRLLGFIESIEKERAQVAARTTSELERARQYYLLMDYRSAIRYLSLFLSRKPAAAQRVEATFFKGRAHEELGEVQEAVAEYNTVIADDPSVRWARQANRRLIMLGDFYETRRQVSAEARKRLEQYQDALFADKVGQFASMVNRSSLREELMSQIERQQRPAGKGADTLVDFINRIGTFDLMGEEAQKKRLEEERALQERIKGRDLTPPQRRELVRQNMVSQHPYRSATAITSVIADHASELQYLYNRTLRRGGRLSGRVLVSMQIGADGTVQPRVTNSTIGDKEFEEGVLESIRRWHFRPVPDSLGVYTVNYPFEFYREE